jgi:hypothetical protein
MQSNLEYHAGIHPALTSFADECVATLARLIAYLGAAGSRDGRAGRQAWLERGFALATGLRRQRV